MKLCARRKVVFLEVGSIEAEADKVVLRRKELIILQEGEFMRNNTCVESLICGSFDIVDLQKFLFSKVGKKILVVFLFSNFLSFSNLSHGFFHFLLRKQKMEL